MRILTILISMVLLLSCSQTLPVPGGKNTTVLIIPMEGVRTTSFGWKYNIDYEISNCTGAESLEKIFEGTIDPRTGIGFLIISDLPNGTCTLSKTVLLKKATHGKWSGHMRQRQHMKDFNLEKGRITFFPKLIEFYQRETDHKVFKFNYEFGTLNSRHKDEIISKLKLDSNFSKWEFLE